jgi:hypothetical protein
VDPGRETIPVTKKSLSCGPTLNAQLATKCELDYNLFSPLEKDDIIKNKSTWREWLTGWFRERVFC